MENWEEIAHTNYSCLYRVKKDGLFYIYKKIDRDKVGIELLEREKEVNNRIENQCRYSVCIPILRIEEKDGETYAVMQYKHHGLFLSDIIKELEERYGAGEIPLTIQADLLEQILRTLGFLHSCCKMPDGSQRGYLHLDLHPGNIFFESIDMDCLERENPITGTVKFIDWQNSLEIEKDEYARTEKKLGFTYGFSSPEHKYQKKFSKAADLYGVAALGARMYTGEKILGYSMNTYPDILEKKSDKCCDNPIATYLWETILYQGLSTKTKDRYQSADEMLERLYRLKKCIKAFEKRNYHTLFIAAFDAGIPKSGIQMNRFMFDKRGFHDAVESLGKDLHQLNVRVNPCDRSCDLLGELENLHREEVLKEDSRKLREYAIKSCNHTGNFSKAKKLKEGFREDFENKIGDANSWAVGYADRLNIEKAYEIVKKERDKKEKLICCMEELGISNEEIADCKRKLGKTYSASGQYLAWKYHYKDIYKEEAVPQDMPYELFDKALALFKETDARDDRKITISHLLQYALMIGDTHTFWKYAEEYFGAYPEGEEEVFSSWLQRRLPENPDEEIRDLFSIHVLIKAANTFCDKKMEGEAEGCFEKCVTRQFVDLLINIVSGSKLEKKHPSQLIYCNSAILLWKYRQLYGEEVIGQEVIDALFERAVSLSKKLDKDEKMNIFTLISYQIKWLYSHYCKEDGENKKLHDDLMQKSKEEEWNELSGLLLKIRAENLESLLGYEHR